MASTTLTDARGRTRATSGDQPPVAGKAARRAGMVLLPAIMVVFVLAVVVYAVFPTRSWLEQRETISEREAELSELLASNEALEERVGALQTAAEIERIARQDHGLVMPDEEAYAVLPPAPPPVRLPQAWPFTELAGTLGS